MADYHAMGGAETLARLLSLLESGKLGDPLPVLAYIAGQHVELPAAEFNASCRRALLLRASGGDPAREPEIDDPSTKLLAVELNSAERGAQLAGGIDALATLARDLPRVREGLVFLAGDLDLAWRLFALGLLAEELGA
jgi:hypothetical protein